MGVVLGGRGIQDHMDLANKGVRKDVSGKNQGVCIRETDIKNL